MRYIHLNCNKRRFSMVLCREKQLMFYFISFHTHIFKSFRKIRNSLASYLIVRASFVRSFVDCCWLWKHSDFTASATTTAATARIFFVRGDRRPLTLSKHFLGLLFTSLLLHLSPSFSLSVTICPYPSLSLSVLAFSLTLSTWNALTV